jgi:hypothetical protein
MLSKMCMGLHVKYRCYSCQILIKLAFSRQFSFSKKTLISKFVKISPVVDELFHADRHDVANSRFSQFFLNFQRVAKHTRTRRVFFKLLTQKTV